MNPPPAWPFDTQTDALDALNNGTFWARTRRWASLGTAHGAGRLAPYKQRSRRRGNAPGPGQNPVEVPT